VASGSPIPLLAKSRACFGFRRGRLRRLLIKCLKASVGDQGVASSSFTTSMGTSDPSERRFGNRYISGNSFTNSAARRAAYVPYHCHSSSKSASLYSSPVISLSISFQPSTWSAPGNAWLSRRSIRSSKKSACNVRDASAVRVVFRPGVFFRSTNSRFARLSASKSTTFCRSSTVSSSIPIASRTAGSAPTAAMSPSRKKTSATCSVASIAERSACVTVCI